MALFRKKPVVIEAFKWEPGVPFPEGFEALHPLALIEDIAGGEEKLRIRTLEGPIFASVGDWVIKGVKGEFYPCKPDIFEATYEEVIETPAGPMNVRRTG